MRIGLGGSSGGMGCAGLVVSVLLFVTLNRQPPNRGFIESTADLTVRSGSYRTPLGDAGQHPARMRDLSSYQFATYLSCRRSSCPPSLRNRCPT
jgi:hypothetical protein